MDKEIDKKEINLMPEDLRSKESGILSKAKIKNEFDFDFVSPKDSALKKVVYQSDISIWEKIKRLFNRPKAFGQASAKLKETVKLAEHKIIEAPKKIAKPAFKEPLHIPDKEIKLLNKEFHIDYANSVLNDIKPVKKNKSGLSIWDKLKKLFAFKTKSPKLLEIERVPARPIIAKSIEAHVKIPAPIDILNEENIKAVPESKIPDKDKSIDKTVEEPVKPELISKFHHPEPRIRAKLLDNSGGVDLIPDSAKTRSWQQIIKLLVTTSVIFSVIIAVFYGFLFYQGQTIIDQNNKKHDQITSIEKQIIEYKSLNDDITQLGDEIKTIHKLLSFHFYWTNFFQLLEKYTISDVYYSGITASNGGALTLQATATDFEALARQIKVLQQEEAQEFATAIEVSSANYREGIGVGFNITIVLNPSLFVYNENYIYENQPLPTSL